MKKMRYLAIPALTLLLAACSESKFEYHQSGFVPMKPEGMEFFADQTYDSIGFFSYDPWTAKVVAENPWFTISPTNGDARPGISSLTTRIDVRMDQNTTGKNRKGSIVINTYEDNTMSMPVYQRTWLNIMYPTRIISGETYEDQTARFDLPTVAYNEKSQTITFHTYQKDATLSKRSSWISLDQTTFAEGTHSVKLSFQPNESQEKRMDTLTLTSGKISTDIYVTQEGKKK